MPSEPPRLPVDSARDAACMRRALELAERGWGRTWPNPLVGAIVVRDDEIGGEGWHAEYGGPHAEVNALAEAGERAGGATLYVTLEPCTHWGKTPPCTDAVARAGIARLVFAATDPGPDSAGGGARLATRGVEVVSGVEEEAARQQNAAFFHVRETGTPFVALKYALSLDARLAAEPGRPTAVTGASAREEAHRLRAGYDAIVVGIGTVRADDPALTVRGPLAPRRPPARVVFDTEARLPLGSRLVRTLDAAPVWDVCTQDAPLERRESLAAVGVKVLPLPRGEEGVEIGSALAALYEGGLRALFVEGGGRLGSALLRADRGAWLDLFYAPLFLGENGVPAFAGVTGPGPWSWRLVRIGGFGEDVLVEWWRRREREKGGAVGNRRSPASP